MKYWLIKYKKIWYNQGKSKWEYEYSLVEADEYSKRKSLLDKAMRQLNPREKEIFIARRLTDPALTLEELSVMHNISRERVRQIENKAFEKVQGAMVVA
jgi:RNA polymerase sigma-32 factor